MSCPNCASYDLVKFNCLIKEFKSHTSTYFKILELCEVYDGESEESFIEREKLRPRKNTSAMVSNSIKNQRSTLENLDDYVKNPSTINEVDESCNVEADELEDENINYPEQNNKDENLKSDFEHVLDF